MRTTPIARALQLLLAGMLALGTVAFAACGGEDDAAETVTASGITGCLEEAGQSVGPAEDLDFFAHVAPPDLKVESDAGLAALWVMDDAAGAASVVEDWKSTWDARDEAQLSDTVMQSGNVAAVVPTGGQGYRDILAGCMPPA